MPYVSRIYEQACLRPHSSRVTVYVVAMWQGDLVRSTYQELRHCGIATRTAHQLEIA